MAWADVGWCTAQCAAERTSLWAALKVDRPVAGWEGHFRGQWEISDLLGLRQSKLGGKTVEVI